MKQNIRFKVRAHKHDIPKTSSVLALETPKENQTIRTEPDQACVDSVETPAALTVNWQIIQVGGISSLPKLL